MVVTDDLKLSGQADVILQDEVILKVVAVHLGLVNRVVVDVGPEYKPVEEQYSVRVIVVAVVTSVNESSSLMTVVRRALDLVFVSVDPVDSSRIMIERHTVWKPEPSLNDKSWSATVHSHSCNTR